MNSIQRIFYTVLWNEFPGINKNKKPDKYYPAYKYLIDRNATIGVRDLIRGIR